MKYVAQLWQRDRATHAPAQDVGDFKGLATLRLNFRLTSYVSLQYLWTVRWGNGYTTTLLLEVFTQKLRSSRYWIEIEFYINNKNRLLSHPLGA